MKNTIYLIAGIIVGIVLVGGTTAYAASMGAMQVDSLKVGQQGVGGVTYFNGTIVNETTNNGVDNPITVGDGLRVDGYITRGTDGPGGANPVKVKDDLQVYGDILDTNGSSYIDTINDTASQASTNYEYIAVLSHMIDCLGNMAEIYPSYIPTSAWISCWNSYISGHYLPAGEMSVAGDLRGNN